MMATTANPDVCARGEPVESALNEPNAAQGRATKSRAADAAASHGGSTAARRAPFGEYRALLRLAAPIVMVGLVNLGMGLTDTVMVSAYFGADALAAVAVGSDLQSIVFYCFAGIVGGLTPFYTSAIARRQVGERLHLDCLGRLLVVVQASISVPLI
jgi:multidrug resistance protein, MATE family